MADFSINLTVPDDKLTELLDALHHEFGANETVDPVRAYTTLEIKALLKRHVTMYLQHKFRMHKRYLETIEQLDVT